MEQTIDTARLVLTFNGRCYPIRPQGVSIGRGPGNDITLGDEQVSRRHARAWIQGEQAYIQDIGSKNGTFVNEERITNPQPLEVGDQVKVGHTTLTLELDPATHRVSRRSPVLVLMLILGGALVVAGFHEDSVGHGRGWIKTDAEISPGNSGGMAINEAGQLIGVPTFVSAEARTLGRIGGLRPINLARPLLRGTQ